jgi:hypothetical protein
MLFIFVSFSRIEISNHFLCRPTSNGTWVLKKKEEKKRVKIFLSHNFKKPQWGPFVVKEFVTMIWNQSYWLWMLWTYLCTWNKICTVGKCVLRICLNWLTKVQKLNDTYFIKCIVLCAVFEVLSSKMEFCYQNISYLPWIK